MPLLVATEVRPSPAHGLGLFAAQDVPAGAEVWRHDPDTVLRLTRAQLAALRASHGGGGALAAQVERFAYAPLLGGRGGAGAYLELDDMRYVNHAPGAAANVSNVRRGGAHSLVAARDIRRGEELLEDYASEYRPELCAAFLARADGGS